jgi:hypothetical protein
MPNYFKNTSSIEFQIMKDVYFFCYLPLFNPLFIILFECYLPGIDEWLAKIEELLSRSWKPGRKTQPCIRYGIRTWKCFIEKMFECVLSDKSDIDIAYNEGL